jgi:hypothetical protein
MPAGLLLVSSYRVSVRCGTDTWVKCWHSAAQFSASLRLESWIGAHGGIRTEDLILTKNCVLDELYPFVAWGVNGDSNFYEESYSQIPTVPANYYPTESSTQEEVGNGPCTLHIWDN